MNLFGLFGEKESPQKPCFVAVHCRGFSDSSVSFLAGESRSNIKRHGHWALQVGDLFYEVPEPSDAFVWRMLNAMDTISLKRAAWNAEGQPAVSEDIEEDNRTLLVTYIMQKLKPHLEAREELATIVNEEKPFVLCPNKPGKGKPGEGGDQGLLPLLISKGSAWQDLPSSSHEIIPMRIIRTTSRIVTGSATQIYKKLFRWGYDATSYNSQAFVLYLLFSINVLAGEAVAYDKCLYQVMWENSKQRLFQDPSIDFPHVGASLVIYQMWKDVVGDETSVFPVSSMFPVKWKHDASQAARTWVIEESKIDYKKVVPPALMTQSFEGRQLLSIPRMEEQLDPRSHAAHAIDQMQHDLLQNRSTVLNDAVVRQVRREHGRTADGAEK